MEERKERGEYWNIASPKMQQYLKKFSNLRKNNLTEEIIHELEKFI